MQITHQEARKLIQFHSDTALNSQEKVMLLAHLETCSECSTYAEEINEVERLLPSIMKRQWDLRPLPFSIDAIRARGKSKTIANNILTIRTAIITVMLAVFTFSVWQFTLAGHRSTNQLPMGIPPAPTPSAQSTSTKINYENCELILYTVQPNDTLASIAYHFSTSEEQIMTINHMTTETVITSTNLMIPVCNFTPTSTVNAVGLTTTYTPTINSIVATPDG